MNLPDVVSESEWQAVRDELLVSEKQATRNRDALSAERRRLPMYRFDAGYRFDGPEGEATLLDMFEGRRQLIVYHYRFEPGNDPCGGCAMFTDTVGHLAHLHAWDTSFALTSRAPQAEIQPFRERMEWDLPWYTGLEPGYKEDLGIGEGFGLSVFLRDDEGGVYRTYLTSQRGVEHIGNPLDLTPLGRQEEWEDSPEGWPQAPTYSLGALHDSYADAAKPPSTQGPFTALPEVVSQEEWQSALDELRVKEKQHTRRLDALAAERRRLPMVRIAKDYEFERPGGEKAGLIDLFEGRRQLVVYHFMLAPGGEPCAGCSMVADAVGHLAHLNARDTSFAMVSLAPSDEIAAAKERMGWGHPWVSSYGSDFNRDFGRTTDSGEMFGLSVFIRNDQGNVYRTYFTTNRGVEALGSVWTYVDLTPLGRQEDWEDTPEGRPQGPRYEWWDFHDEYDDARVGAAT
jgi:predicted dithiol-disulfide oxidoreductase (DUF899 family)